MRRLLLATLMVVLASPVYVATAHGATGKIWGTYYASRFAGRTTACGGVYREHRLTVASSSLPCGALVRVNFRGRSVVALVTDRCNCGIDLSRAAARKIGLLDVGAAWVEVQRVE